METTPKVTAPPTAPSSHRPMTRDRASYLYDKFNGPKNRNTPGGGSTRESFIKDIQEANKPGQRERLAGLNKSYDEYKKKDEDKKREDFLSSDDNGKYLRELSKSRNLNLNKVNDYLNRRGIEGFGGKRRFDESNLSLLYNSLDARGKSSLMNALRHFYGTREDLQLKRELAEQKEERMRIAAPYAEQLGVDNESVQKQIQREGGTGKLEQALRMKRFNEMIKRRGSEAPNGYIPEDFNSPEYQELMKKALMNRELNKKSFDKYLKRYNEYNHIYDYRKNDGQLFRNIEGLREGNRNEPMPENVKRLFGI